MQFVQYIMKFILCPRLIGESLDFFFTVALLYMETPSFAYTSLNAVIFFMAIIDGQQRET